MAYNNNGGAKNAVKYFNDQNASRVSSQPAYQLGGGVTRQEKREAEQAHKDLYGMSSKRRERLKNKVHKIDAKKGTEAGDKSRAMRKLAH
jgi:hypothetical protein